MQLKKSWFGYLNSVIGTFISSAFVYALFILMIENIENANGTSFVAFNQVPISVIISISICVLVILFGFLFNFLKSLIRIKENHTNICGVLFVIATVVLFALFTAKIALAVLGYLPSQFSFDLIYKNRLLSLFMGNVVSFDNIVYKLYSYALIFFIKVFGFNNIVLLICNSVIILLAVFLTYISVKILFGRLSACFTLISFIVLDDCLKLVWDLQGLCLWFLFVAFIAFLFAFFGELFIKKYPVTSLLTAFALIFGFLSLREFFFIPFDLRYVDLYNELINFPCNYNAVYLCILLVFAVWGFALNILSDFDRASFANICLLISAALYFFYDYNFSFELIIIFSVAAGLGFKLLCTMGYKHIEEPASEGIVLEDNTDKTLEDGADKALESSETVLIVNEKPEDIYKPIDNPIPLPKKHVKKSMDFPHEISKDLMKFDIDIKPGDDYDIK